MMTKKSQFYIFAAVIFCSLFFLGTLNQLTVFEYEQNLEKNYMNYVIEGINTINTGTYNKDEISVLFNNYTNSFLDYSKMKDFRPGIIYFIIFPDNSTIAYNRMSKQAIVISGIDKDTKSRNIYTIEPYIEKNINIGTNFSVELDNSKYFFNVSSGENIELKVLFSKEV